MMKILSLIFITITLFILANPTTVLAQEKRNYSNHILILQQFILSYSTTELYDTKVLGLTTKEKTIKPTPESRSKTAEQTMPTKQEAPEAPSSSDAMTYVIQGINTYRASQGLGAVRTSAETCAFAATRAQEINGSFSHDGFQSRADNKSLPYSSWSGITENIAMTSDYKNVVDMWANSPGHAANMRADTPYVCVRQNGNYFAYEGMKP